MPANFWEFVIIIAILAVISWDVRSMLGAISGDVRSMRHQGEKIAELLGRISDQLRDEKR